MRGEWVSDSFVRVFGYTIPEINARGGWQSMVYPDDLPLAIEHAQKVISGKSDTCEMRFVSRDGEARWLRDYAKPVFDEAQGRVVRIYSASQDITERKRAEEEIRKRGQELATLYHASQVFAQSLGQEVIGQRLIETMEQLLGYEYGAVLVVDEATQEVLPLALSDQGRGPEFVVQDKEYVRSKGLRVGQGIVGWAIQHGQPVRVGDIRQDPRYFAMRENIRSEKRSVSHRRTWRVGRQMVVPSGLTNASHGLVNCIDDHMVRIFDKTDTGNFNTHLGQLAIQFTQRISEGWLDLFLSGDLQRRERLLIAAILSKQSDRRSAVSRHHRRVGSGDRHPAGQAGAGV